MQGPYKTNGIDATTKVLAVLGNPVTHSLSPAMHNAALMQTGCNAVMVAFQVNDIATAIDGIRGLGIAGAAVTLPFKESVIPHLDKIDDTARQIGAVNTIVNENGVLTGFNSDALGAVRALQTVTTIRNKNVLMIGAGGAARAVGYGLCSKGAGLYILNRSKPRGEALAEQLNAHFCQRLEGLSGVDIDIIVNTTSVGMVPNDQAIPVSAGFLTPRMVVMDIVYNPLETLLLKKARQIKATVINGLSMFVYQGAFQFEKWTGVKAPISLMQNVAEAFAHSPTIQQETDVHVTGCD